MASSCIALPNREEIIHTYMKVMWWASGKQIISIVGFCGQGIGAVKASFDTHPNHDIVIAAHPRQEPGL